jgi:sulfur carrier protein
MIRVNDKWELAWRQAMTVQDVLQARDFTHHHIVVSVNNVLVPPAEYSTRMVTDGDQVRVVHVIGGG